MAILGVGELHYQKSAGAVGESGLHTFMGAGFEFATAAMVLVDDDQLIRCANPAATTLFATGDITGRSILDFGIPGRDPRAELLAAGRPAGERNPAERSVVIRLDSGRSLGVLTRMDAVCPPAGGPLYLLQLRDVTTAVANATARAESESQYRQLVSNLPGMSVVLFDHDLRVLKVGGEVLDRSNYDVGAMPGQLLTDVLPATVLALLEEPYRAATDGQEADFDYQSPVDGRQYHIRLRPIAATDGTIIGALSLNEDVTVDRARQTLLKQVRQLSNVGSVSYDRVGGWVADDELITLLGIEPDDDVLRALDAFVLDEDRAPTRSAYRAVLASGGETTVQYRLIHGKTGRLRHVSGTMRATVDADRNLLRAIATHVDVTDVVDAHSARVKVADARTLLLRSVSDALGKAPRSVREVMQSIVDVATAALGDGTVLRVFTADGGAVDTDLVSHRDKSAERANLCLRDSARWEIPDIVDASGEAGELWSSIRNINWRRDFQRRLGHPVEDHVQHFISAAVRHDGIILGYLRVYRAAPDQPYQIGDDDLVQVLADRIGYVIAEGRVRVLLERQRTEHRAIADRLQELTTEQRELLEQLGGVAERERTLLAEAIHDGPMQLVVSVMMRLDSSSIDHEPIDEAEMEGLIVTLETSIQRLRTLITALTPPDLSKGLGMALRELAEGIFLGTTTQITVLGEAHVNLTPLGKGNAHRILREAMVNARKHARAGHVVLELTECDNTVIARLSDDGAGATSLDAGPGHLGMVTMRARAEADGGRLDVTSVPGAGTTVVLTLPTVFNDRREHLRSEDVLPGPGRAHDGSANTAGGWH